MVWDGLLAMVSGSIFGLLIEFTYFVQKKHRVYPTPLFNLLVLTKAESIGMQYTISDFIVNNIWDRQKLSQMFPADIVYKICSILLHLVCREDKIIWGSASN